MSGRPVEFIGLGFCSNDYLCRIPELIPDGKVEISEHEIQGGGPGGGATVAAARLGLHSAFVTTLGDDFDGRKMIEDFRTEGVETGAIRICPDCKSPIAYCLITPDGRRTVAWTKNHIPDLVESDLPADMIAGARVLHLDGHHTAAAIAAARIARDHGVLVSIDAGTIRPRIGELLDLADLVIASEDFCRRWSRCDDLRTGIRALEAHHNLVTAVTMGAQGAIYVDPESGEVRLVPAAPAEVVVDTTGAGDSFHGAFVYSYLESGDIRRSMEFASRFAALKCRRLGARAGQPTIREMRELYPEYR